MAWSSATRSNTFKRRSTANTLRDSSLNYSPLNYSPLNYSPGLLSQVCRVLTGSCPSVSMGLLTPVFDYVQTLQVFDACVKFRGGRAAGGSPWQPRAGC